MAVDSEKKKKKSGGGSKDKSVKDGGGGGGKDKPAKGGKDVKEKNSGKDKGGPGENGKGKGAGAKDKKGKAGAPSSSTANAPDKKPKKKKGAKVIKKVEEDFYEGIDMPPSESEEEYEKEEVEKNQEIDVDTPRDYSKKDVKKAKKIEQQQAYAADAAKREAYLDDSLVFSVTVAGAADGKSSTADANARDIKVSNFSVSAKKKELFLNTNMTIAFGRRYGLVGPNGTGKTTVMKLISRRMLPVPDNLDVLLVEQEVIGDERSALEAVMQADEKLTSLKEEEEMLSKLTLEDPVDEDEEDGEDSDGEGKEDSALQTAMRLQEIQEQIEEIGGSTAISRAAKILAGLGFSPDMQKRATQSFSGGWRMRISLARALFMLPTVLLLDEPTNHLDLRAVLWLEEYLLRWKKTLVVVSHDRDFLNTVSTDIIHLHEKKLWQYKGNFDSFEKMFEQKRREQNKMYDKYVSEMKKAKTSKAAQDKAREKAKMDKERRAKRSGRKAVADEEDEQQRAEVVSKWKDYNVNFAFPEPTELGHPLLQLVDVEFEYPSRPDFKLAKVNVGVGMGTRAAIVGPNGAGKTTFINLLAGELSPTSGEFRKKPKLRVGRYSQHFVEVLNMESNPVFYLQSLYPEEFAGSKGQQMLRGRLGRFGLAGEHHMTPIAKLSGGQKARVVFTMIALMQPHLLLLDEPTNNLDMESIDALGDAVAEFSGGVVIISHDSRLVSRVCEDEMTAQLWVVDNGTVEVYDGTFEDYRDETIEEIVGEMEE
ncbi:hypothetical protein NDN08_001098 [Rhodosorus marinus]|uniref:Probable ATP-dependent transporter ycf16 n=1 Tax=Rhodosorus marinus TaxID=101924 RepID=A0AAV8UPT4_9RHOD|nr:hypothetical protein NDN08_001098 [Rhodosorus marinus]